MMRAIPRVSLVDTAVDRIREFIERRHLKPGDRLPTEAELVEQLGVSRTVVREAIRQLECLGLLTVRRARGMFVAERRDVINCVKLIRSALAISPRDLLHFNEFREGMECTAARHAANSATKPDIAELESLCDAIDEPGKDDVSAMRSDFQFHRRLMAITSNPLMESVLEIIQEMILASMVRTTPQPRDRENSHLRHRAIVAAIKKGNPDAAEKAMRTHMRQTADILHALERQNQQNLA